MLRKTSRDGRYVETPAPYGDIEPEEPTELESPTSAPGQPGVVTRASAPVAATSTNSASVIDATASFDGRYEAAQDLIVMGTISGEVICKGLLTIEQSATAKAKIEAREANIRGRVDGDVVCSGRLVVAATAHITGTIKAGALVVEDGATIKGSVETASAASSELELNIPRAARKSMPERPDSGEAAASGAAGGRWTRSRDVPTFALVSSDERAAPERS